MKKWKIIYKCKTDGDCCSVWERADTAEEAVRNAKREYWDIESVIEVRPID